MEKERTTILEYYTNLFTLLRGDKNSFVITVEDIYREARNLNSQLGIKTTPVGLCGTKKTFLKIFKNYITESVIDSTYKGRGKREIYSLELKPSDIVGLEVKLLKAQPSLKRRFCSIKKAGEIESGPSASITTKKAAEKTVKPKSLIPGKNLPRKDWLFKFYELLKVANIAPGNKVNKKQIKSTMLLKEIPSMTGLIESWRSTLVRGGIVAHFSLYKNLKKETEVVISDCPSLIRDIGIKYKNWFGVDLKADEVLKITTSIPVEKVLVQPKLKTELPFPVAYTIFAIGGICKKQSSVVNYETIYKILKDNFSIRVSRNEVIEIVRKNASKYLEVCNHGAGGIKFRDINDWEKFNEEFGPRNFKESTYVRLGMTLEEVRKILPNFEIEIVTEFTASDAVYQINYDKSIHSLRSLCNLYRTFRGKDKFFEDNLTKLIQNEIVYVDSRSYVGNIAFEIEC